ncbi:MAG: dockerin type I domain-containing protein [Saprospiraceae bacterium]
MLRPKYADVSSYSYKYLLIAVYLCATAGKIFAQPAFDWARHVPASFALPGGDDQGTAIAEDSAGNFYLSGFFGGAARIGDTLLQGAGGTDGFVAKFNPQGVLLWARVLGGRGADRALGLAVDKTGNTYLTGTFSESIDLDPGPGVSLIASRGQTDVFLCKLDPAGGLHWVRSFGGFGPDTGSKVALDDTAVFLTGDFLSTIDADPGPGIFNLSSGGGQDIFVVSLNLDASFRWAFRVGGNGQDYPGDIGVHEGALYLNGRFSGKADFDPGPVLREISSAGESDAFVASYAAATGNYSWARGFGGKGGDGATGFVIGQDGKIGVGGYFSDTLVVAAPQVLPMVSKGGTDVFFFQLDRDGNYITGFHFGGSGSDQVGAVGRDPQGNLFLAGLFADRVDFWPGPDSLIAASAFGQDIFIVRYDSLFRPTAFSQIGNGQVQLSGMLASLSGKVLICGSLRGKIDFDPGNGRFYPVVTPGNDSDAFLAGYTADAALLWVRTIGGIPSATNDQISALAAGPDGSLYAGGRFQSSADFMSGLDTLPVFSEGFQDAFVQKFSANGEMRWLIRVAGAGEETIVALGADKTENCFVAGNYSKNLAFISGSDTLMQVQDNSTATFFLAKFDQAGNLLWTVQPSPEGAATVLAMDTDSDGQTILLGNVIGTLDFDPGPARVLLGKTNGVVQFMAKYDALGRLTWARAITEDPGMILKKIRLHPSGAIYLAGVFAGTVNVDVGRSGKTISSAGGLDICLLKYDGAGDLSWARVIGGPDLQTCEDMVVGPDNRLIVAGNFNGNTDFDAGPGTNAFRAQIIDGFLAVYDLSGNFQMVRTFPTFGISSVTGIATDSLGAIFVAGVFLGNINVDPGKPAVNASPGAQNTFLLELNKSGNTRWSAFFKGPGFHTLTALCISAGRRLYAGGYFTQGFEFPGGIFSSKNGEDGFIFSCAYTPYDLRIQGRVTASDGQAMKGLNVRLSGLEVSETTTDSLGGFVFSGLSPGIYGISPIAPTSSDLPDSTDLLILARHLTNGQKISDPYRMIAADVQRSGSLTALDLLKLKRIVDGSAPLQPAWRFFPSNAFNPVRPLEFQEPALVNMVQGTAIIHLTGIRMGLLK